MKGALREDDVRMVADAVPTVMLVHANDGTVEWANARWYELTGLPRHVATSLDGIARVVEPGDLRRMLRAFERAVVMGEPYEAEIRIKPDGADDAELRLFLLRGVPIRRADGTVARWAASATDVHDRRQAGVAARTNFAREHRASLAFQQAALPRRLPVVPGLSFSAIYEAAQADALVGGDWYDAFALRDGRIVLSAGDVSGNGLNAAVTMSAVRQAIRGAAQLYPDPVAVLDAADRVLRSEQPDTIVTAFVGVLEPQTLGFAYASAGHPPALLSRHDGTVVELTAVDLPLGLRDERTRVESQWMILPDRSLLVLYTDGLTEATRDILEGERRVHAALSSPAIAAASEPAEALRNAVLTEAVDDVAILIVRIDLAGRAGTQRR